MALTGDTYAKSQFRVGIAEETTFGTPITTQASFKELFIFDPPDVDWASGTTRDVQKRTDGKRVLSNTDIFVSKTGGTYTCTISGLLTDNTVDLLHYGVMQDLVSEAATTPFLKTFEWDAATTQPDFAADAGKFFTINIYDPEANGRHRQLTSCIIKTLVITADPSANGGRASFDATFISGFVPVFAGLTVTPASWTSPGTTFYHFPLLLSKTIYGVDTMVIGRYDLTLENNAVRVGFNASGNAHTYALGMPTYSAAGNVSVLYQGVSTAKLVNYFTSEGDGSFVLGWGNGTAEGTYQYNLNANISGYLEDKSPAEGTIINLPFECVDDGTNEAVEVLIANAIDRAW